MDGCNDVVMAEVDGTEVGGMADTTSSAASDAHDRVGHPVESEASSSASSESNQVDWTANGMRRTRLEHMFRPLKP